MVLPTTYECVGAFRPRRVKGEAIDEILAKFHLSREDFQQREHQVVGAVVLGGSGVRM